VISTEIVYKGQLANLQIQCFRESCTV